MGKTIKETKYAEHDIHVDDVKEYDIERIRESGIRKFVNTRRARQIPLVIECFMEYLSKNGYRIVKDNKNGCDD